MKLTSTKGLIALGLAAALLLGGAPGRSQTPDAERSRRWHEDIAYFARELPKRHMNAFHRMPKAEFDAAVARLDAAVPTLQDDQVVVALMQILGQIGDAHTSLRMPPELFPRYPIQLYDFGGELRVTQAAEPYRAALGARLAAVNGTDIAAVRAKVVGMMTQDENRWYVLSSYPNYLVRSGVLHGLGVIPQNGPAAFTFQADDGRRFDLTLAPVAPDPPPVMADAAASTPLYRRRPTDQFWTEPLPEAGALYVCFRGYDDLARNAKAMFEELDRTQARRLIIDMRQNGGGDFTKVREQIIPQLRKRPQIDRKGGLYVVIGRRTFSAAMSNASDFRKETKAVLVGEPTGERPNSYQENRQMTLPNSRIVVSYSTRFYKFADSDIEAIEPDQRIDITWADYAAGRDPVMDWILKQP